MRKIELLSPARNAETAREAILHGADAVYIGAPRFGARASAGNSLDDIREVVDFAHIYGVKVYVTLNTILFDEELEDARRLVFDLYEIHVDALIVQDMAFLEMDLPPIPLHASTQMDNRTAEKVRWLRYMGFEQVVLARELSLHEIGDIHSQVPGVSLEVFVHGATCVSYNGQCYASQYCFGRSANRGECAQFCRLPFDLIDEEGHVVKDELSGQPVHQRHLLSLHDMNRSEELEQLLDAGVASLKIEGRLKDTAYVKNVTAYYRRKLDDIIARRPGDYIRSSEGVSTVDFVPQLDRTFNRGFSNYFLNGRTHGMVQMCSPKSMGQPVGHVKEIRRNCFTVSGTASFSNGDGLCFIDQSGALQGFRVNRVEGNCLYPKDMPEGIHPRTPLFRNFDQAFTVQLARPTAHRRLPVTWRLSDTPVSSPSPNASVKEGDTSPISFELSISCSDGISVSRVFSFVTSVARTPQRDNIERQLSRLGDTPFQSVGVDVCLSNDWFIPSSVLAEWRRILADELVSERIRFYHSCSRACLSRSASASEALPPCVTSHLSYMANVSNHLAHSFYTRHGVRSIQPALELSAKSTSKVGSDSAEVLMTLRYCPRHEIGLCGKRMSPLFLRSSDGRIFPLRFNCRNCQVQVLTPTKPC